jgi:hypothetical protein
MTSRAGVEPRGFAAHLAGAWARTYTLGLDAAARSKRLAQIDSDVWEQLADLTEDGRGSWRSSSAILSRLLRGVPADLLWRLQLSGLTTPANRTQLALAAVLFLVLGAALAAAAGLRFSSTLETRGEVVSLGSLEQFAPLPWCSEHHHFCLTHSPSGRLIALYTYDTNGAARERGCTVQWDPDFEVRASVRPPGTIGVFRSGCTGATFDIHGTFAYGPGPRDLDQFLVTVSPNGDVSVDTRTLVCGRLGGQPQDCSLAPR